MSDSQRPPAGSVDQFVSELGRHQRQLYLYILRLVVQPADAEDLLQETNMVLWQKFDQFQPGSNFLAWAGRIAQHKVLQFREGRGRDAALVSQAVIDLLAEESRRDHDALETRHRALETCLQKLRAEDRQLIARRYLEGASGESVAREVQRPINSVYQSLSRIRRTLHDCISRETSVAEEQP